LQIGMIVVQTNKSWRPLKMTADLSKAFRPGHEQKRVNVDFPLWMIAELDKESSRLGVPRQSLIKVWLAERLEKRKTGKRAKVQPAGRANG